MRPDLFDDAMGTLPPSTIDVKTIVARQERRKAMHRGGAALLGVTAVALTVVAGIGLRAEPGIDQSTAAPSVVSLPSTKAETPEDKAARVQAAWLRAVEKVLPGAAWRAGHDGSYETPSRGHYFDDVAGPKPPSMFVRSNSSHGEPLLDDKGNILNPEKGPVSAYLYHNFGILKIGANEGKFAISTVWRGSTEYNNSKCSTGADGVMTCGDDFFCTHGSQCERSKGPNGEEIFTQRQSVKLDGYKLNLKTMNVWIRSADGTRAIEMSITNRAGGDDGPEPKTVDLALTHEQIVAILLEPGLMI